MATVVSRVLGFAKALLLAAVVGTIGSRGADAFAVANQLPNNVFWLVSSGVFAAILVPQVVGSTRHSDGGVAHVNKLLTIGALILMAATAGALLLAPQLVQLYTSQWDADQVRLAVVFAWWCLPQIVFYGVFSLVGEVLNARRRFAPAAWAPLANNVVALVGLIVFVVVFGAYPGATGAVADWSSAMIATLAGFTTFGVAAQAGVVVWAWRRAGWRFRPDFRWRGVELGRASRVAMWTFAIVVIGQILGIVQSRVAGLATGLGASLFAASTAWLLFMLPYSVIAVSLGTVYFTRFSELGATNDHRALVREIRPALRGLALAMSGAAVALGIAAVPIGRAFTDSAEDALQMAWLLAAYLVGLTPFALLYLFQRAFYAIGAARTVFIYTCIQAAVLTIGTLLLPMMLPSSMLAIGVAVVQSVAVTVQTLAASILLRQRLGPLGGRSLILTVGRSVVACVGAAVPAVLLYMWAVGLDQTGWAMSNRALALLGAAAISIVFSLIYLPICALLREPLAVQALTWLRHRRQ